MTRSQKDQPSTALTSFRASSTMAVCEQAAALLAKVKTELPECEDVEQLVEMRDKAEAMRVFLRQRDAALLSQNDAAEIKLRTERRIGELTGALQKPSSQEIGKALGGTSKKGRNLYASRCRGFRFVQETATSGSRSVHQCSPEIRATRCNTGGCFRGEVILCEAERRKSRRR